MVADDNKDLNDSFCKFLTKDKDIKIISQPQNGLEVLEKYQELKPDLLLLDLEMPKMNGLEVINILSKDPKEKEIKNIIVISGNDNMRMQLCQMSKVYISERKPFHFDSLLETIRQFAKEKENRTRDISITEIDNFLSDIHIQTHKKNTIILRDAILTAYKETMLLRNINELYKTVRRKK